MYLYRAVGLQVRCIWAHRSAAWKLLPAPEVVCVCWTVRAEMFARELSEVISVLEYTELSHQMCINQYARPSASYIRTNLCLR